MRINHRIHQESSILIDELIGNADKVNKLKNDHAYKELVGEFTLDDISKALLAPSQDPRTEFVSFEFRTDAAELKDIKINQYYPGIVTNITQFGAFVDLGIKENGLIHVSQISDKYVENALEFLKVGQEVKARVMDVDLERKRISLTLKSEGGDKRTAAKPLKKSNTSKKPQKTKPPKESSGELRNNAFAALKNLKIK